MKEIHFEFPLDGDVLLDGVDGAPSEGCLTVAARVAGGDSVSVNGVAARREGEAWVCPVSLKPGRNTLIARSGSDEARVRALYWPGACGRYRFTVDDCIRCFEDLNAHDYASIFENPYLALWKRAHDLYGSRVHINAFERSVDGAFDLSMMTDRYRDEFIRNSDWLSITFHSVAEFPDYPYRNAGYAEVVSDCARVTAQIARFAGREVLRNTTTLHWGTATREGVRALRDAGFRALCGYLCFNDAGEPMVSYHLSRARIERAMAREGWMDFDLDVFFPKLDFVLNAPTMTADRVKPFLDDLASRPHEGRFIQTVIHEQYFYNDYHHYEPDYAQRVLAMAEWMADHGYESASLTALLDGVL